jgi:MFS family permease
MPSPRLVLAMLLLVYTFNFLDRQMLGILAGPIKADLGLTDTQFGAIGGLAFALLYSMLGVPLAYLADRTSRTLVISGALTAWSGFTLLCGFATSYWQLFFCRLGVGSGEAGGVAPSYALIADYFPPERRAKALGIFSLGIPVGLAFGTLIGAYLATLVDWRAAFIVMGCAGIVLAPIFKFVVRDIPQAQASAAAAPAPVHQAFRIVAGKPAFWLMAVAGGCSSMCGYGLALWMPSVLVRSFGLELIPAAQFVGTGLLIGGTTGVVCGGWLADRLGRRDRGAYAWLPAIAWLIAAPGFAAGLLAPNLLAAWIFLVLPNGLNIFWMGPVTNAVQHLVPRHMRATASGSFLLINNLLGLGIGPLLMGFLSDRLTSRFGDEALRYSVVICLSFYVLAALLIALAVKSLRCGWIEDDGRDAAMPESAATAPLTARTAASS